MSRIKIINKFGVLTGWRNITVNMMGRDLEGISSVQYGDSMDMQNEYGGGNYPVGQSISNYKPENVKLELFAEEVMALQTQLPKGFKLQDIPAFNIIVEYDYQGSLYKDICRNCRIMKVDKPAKQGDGKLTQTIECLMSHIDSNV